LVDFQSLYRREKIREETGKATLQRGQIFPAECASTITILILQQNVPFISMQANLATLREYYQDRKHLTLLVFKIISFF